MIRRLRAVARLVIVWLRAAPSGIAILVAIVALTSFLATAAPLWFDRSSQAGLASLLTTAPRGGSGLEFERSGQIQPGTGDPLSGVAAEGDKIFAQLPATIAGGVKPHLDVIDSQEFLAIGPPQPITDLTLRIQPAAMDAIRIYQGRMPTGHVAITPPPEGMTAFPKPTYEIAISRTTAGVLGVTVGNHFDLTNGSARSGTLVAMVVGLFDVVDPTAERWFGDVTLDQPGIRQLSPERFEYHGVGLLSPDAYGSLVAGPPFQNLRYRWRFVLDPAQVAR